MKPTLVRVLLAGGVTVGVVLALEPALWSHLTWLHEPRWKSQFGRVECIQNGNQRMCVAENGAISFLIACGLGEAPSP